SAGSVLAIDPPGESHHQFLKSKVEPIGVSFSITGLLETVRKYCGPGLNGRIDVAEIPFVCRKLPVRMLIVRLEHQIQLLFAEVRIDDSQRQYVKREVPRG